MSKQDTLVKKDKKQKSDLIRWQEKRQTQKVIFLLIAVVPAMIGYLVLDLYPNISSIYYSFFDYDGVAPKIFIGIDNYTRMFSDPNFWNACKNSLIMLLVFPTFTILISLLLSYQLSNKNFFEFRIHRNVYFLPNVLSSVIVALIFTFLYDGSFGLINKVLNGIGVNIGLYYWLGEEKTALACVLVTMIWGAVGFYLIVFMNAMKGIPKSIYESAILDGASNMVQLFKITVPLLWGVIKVALLFLMIGSIKTYEIIYVLMPGGGVGPSRSTDVLGLFMFNYAFGTGSAVGGRHLLGYACAIGMFMFFVLVTSKLLVDKFATKDTVEF